MRGPDFSHVKSAKKVAKLVRRGELERMLLLPSEFGGDEIPENIVYVPVGIRAVKEQIDLTVIRPLVAEGKATDYEAHPEYQGGSFIPIAIRIEASGPATFSTLINIWGEALERDDTGAG